MNDNVDNEIVVKILLAHGTPINQELYLDIINGLNDRYIPCNEISVNGQLVFSTTQGFINNRKVDKDD